MSRPGHDEVVLLTGFPSFSARKMAEEILRDPRVLVHAVVREKLAPDAEAALDMLPLEQRRRVNVIEGDAAYMSLNPKGEPQLGRRGLYRPMGGHQDGAGFDQMTLLWVLNQADGRHTLLDVAERAGLPFAKVRAAADALLAAKLLAPASEPDAQ